MKVVKTMATPTKKGSSPGVVSFEEIKHWPMVSLSLGIFVLYAATLAGWLRPPSNITAIARFEPVLFAMIGYYFCWLPARRSERALKCELQREAEKAETAFRLKEQADKERAAMEEKIRSARLVLELGSEPQLAAAPELKRVFETSSARNGRRLFDRPAELVKRILSS